MNSQQALRVVASHVAGLIGAGSLEECTGFTPSELAAMNAADVDRLRWAAEEVQRRLYRMGARSVE